MRSEAVYPRYAVMITEPVCTGDLPSRHATFESVASLLIALCFCLHSGLVYGIKMQRRYIGLGYKVTWLYR